ncbi:MAG: MBL fold metallo-hydrolase [Planctomycetales bacterium]|nr:MBL fold metallo-hydrolase [Planctomycetales bacterium]
MIFLGTGTSVGVPALGCGCEVCCSKDPKNKRTRCSVLFGLPGGNLLVDTSPDMRFQLLREGIGIVHAVVYTHEHADHLFGLDDLRLFPFYLGHPVPIYCHERVEQRIRKSYDYVFSPPPNLHSGGVPQLELHNIDAQPFEVLGARVQPIPMRHGPNFNVFGFRIGDIAYCTDTNSIPPESLALLTGLDTLVLDGLRIKPHSTHFHLDAAIEIARQLAPRQTYFTHMSHDLDYARTNAWLPESMELAYDGLRVKLV